MALVKQWHWLRVGLWTCFFITAAGNPTF